jgi:arginine:pyruvate transaminase
MPDKSGAANRDEDNSVNAAKNDILNNITCKPLNLSIGGNYSYGRCQFGPNNNRSLRIVAKNTPPFSSLTERLSGPRSRAWDVTDRADRMEHAGQEIIHLGVGDPDFDTPPAIVDAAIDSLKSGRTHYSPIPGEADLLSAIAEDLATRTGTTVTTDRVNVFPGAQSALFATLLCLAGPNDEVILLEPFYATYEGVARAGGAEVVSVPLPPANHFDLDIDTIAAAVTARTRVILANSPGNPSGAVFSRSSWESLLALCVEKGIWLVSDEVYANLVFDGEYVSPCSLPGAEDHVVVISSISKSHAMTGWRLGWTIAPATLSSHLDNLSQCLLFGVSQFTQDAAAYALRNGTTAVVEMKNKTRFRRDALCDALESINGLIVHRPAGGMFVMVDVSGLGCDGETFANGLLDHGGVAVVPGFAFGDSATNFVRIGYLSDVAVLKKAADKIHDFVSSLSV